MIPEKKNLYRIAITGPESTGKSTIAATLASHYGTIWVPEYAREYLKNLKRSYVEADLLEIAKGQLAREKEFEHKAQQFLFCDTELLVLKIWSQYKYGNTHPYIHENLVRSHYDLYLLMDIDLPWEYDPQREHPDKGKYFFEWFENELKDLKANYQIVNGTKEERKKNAIKIVDDFFQTSK